MYQTPRKHPELIFGIDVLLFEKIYKKVSFELWGPGSRAQALTPQVIDSLRCDISDCVKGNEGFG